MSIETWLALICVAFTLWIGVGVVVALMTVRRFKRRREGVL